MKKPIHQNYGGIKNQAGKSHHFRIGHINLGKAGVTPAAEQTKLAMPTLPKPPKP